jgi:hypothetical protein
MNLFGYNCREVTRLVLEAEERPLSLGERVMLRVHWAACDGCTRFRDHVELMRSALARWRDEQEGDPPG